MIMLKGEQKLLEKLEEFHSLSFEHQMNYDALAFGNVLVYPKYKKRNPVRFYSSSKFETVENSLAIFHSCLFTSLFTSTL